MGRGKHPNTPETFWARVDKSAGQEGCWPWTATTARGYGKISWRGRPNVQAHRVAWELTNGMPPDDLYVLHRCDNRRCCNPSHLFLGTHADNMADMVAKGRSLRGRTDRPRGEDAFAARLTESSVREIRRRSAEGESGYSLAKRFGVTKQNVYQVLRRKTWAHVED